MGRDRQWQEQPTWPYVMIGISTGLLLIITPSHSADQTLYLQHGLLFATGDLRSIHDIERASVMFCATCRVLLQKIEAGVISGDLERTSQNILEELDSTCYICYAIHDAIAESLTTASTVCFLWLMWSLSPADTQKVSVLRELTFHAGYRLDEDEQGNETWINVDFHLQPSASEDATPYQPPVHTSDSVVAQLVRSWLENCCHTHTSCSLDQDNTYRPPRLLHTTPSALKLVEGVQCPEGSGWVTLSHCWGRNPTFLRLKDSNLSEFQKSVPINDIPQTFRDAIVLCERIGAEFLWIDSLCILQEGAGSKQDWLHHANAMRAIYRNAQLNISADWAESSTGGLFKSRHPAHIERPAVTFRAGPLEGRWILTWDTEFGPLSSDSPLRKRGWVVQERLLSSRLVRFCGDYVRWHCREPPFHKSERYPKGMRPSESGRRFLQLPSPSTAELQRLLTNEAYRGFVDIAHLYSHTALTYPDLDKFPAFAGLAEHYSLLFEDQYIAGFLKGHLPRALGWVRDRWGTEEEMSLTRPTSYRAPSWSWAALDCRTFASNLINSSTDADVQDVVDLCQIVSHHVVPRDPLNPYGQLESSSLALRVHLNTCTWDGDTAMDIYQRIRLPEFPSIEHANVTFDTIADSYIAPDQTKFLAIGARESVSDVLGLLVKREEGVNTATYKRIGLIDFAFGHDVSLLNRLHSQPLEEIILI
jgi:hypothetical protein